VDVLVGDLVDVWKRGTLIFIFLFLKQMKHDLGTLIFNENLGSAHDFH